MNPLVLARIDAQVLAAVVADGAAGEGIEVPVFPPTAPPEPTVALPAPVSPPVPTLFPLVVVPAVPPVPAEPPAAPPVDVPPVPAIVPPVDAPPVAVALLPPALAPEPPLPDEAAMFPPDALVPPEPPFAVPPVPPDPDDDGPDCEQLNKSPTDSSAANVRIGCLDFLDGPISWHRSDSQGRGSDGSHSA